MHAKVAEVIGAVTAATVASKAAAMDVISLVTRHTLHWCFLGRPLTVTAVAGESFMGSRQRKIGCFMIEAPQPPAVGVMAVTAGLSQRPFMRVIALMAVVTASRK